MRRGIFLAGGGKDAGKTTISIGLVSYFKKKFQGDVAFMKPLGQKTSMVDGNGVGQDSYLLESVMNLDIPLKYSAPFSTGSGAAEKFILKSEPGNLQKKILKAFKHLASRYRVVIVEGTGHPGVGSVFNLSNSKVASLFNIPVILIIDGGIGSTIDKFNLCLSQFEKDGIKISGVIINKIVPSKLEKVKKLLSLYFDRLNIPVLGFIPYVNTLSQPSLGVIRKELGIENLYINDYPETKKICGFVYAFGNRSEVLDDLSKTPGGVLVVNKGRDEILDSVLTLALSGETDSKPSAIILCGKGKVENRVRKGCEKAGISLMETNIPFYKTIKSLQYKVYKVEPGEAEKIEIIKGTIENNVDMDSVEKIIFGGEKEEKISGKSLFKAIVKGSVGFLGNIIKKK